MGRRGPKPKPAEDLEAVGAWRAKQPGRPKRKQSAPKPPIPKPEAKPKRRPGRPRKHSPADLPPEPVETLPLPPNPEDPPAYLIPEAVDEWRRVLPLLKAENRFAEIDRLALAAYCQCVGRYMRSDKWLTENGPVATVRNDKGEVKSSFIAPHFQVSLKLLDKILAYQKEFGLSPGARQKFEGPEDGESMLSDEDKFFGGLGLVGA